MWSIYKAAFFYWCRGGGGTRGLPRCIVQNIGKERVMEF